MAVPQKTSGIPYQVPRGVTNYGSVGFRVSNIPPAVPNDFFYRIIDEFGECKVHRNLGETFGWVEFIDPEVCSVVYSIFEESLGSPELMGIVVDNLQLPAEFMRASPFMTSSIHTVHQETNYLGPRSASHISANVGLIQSCHVCKIDTTYTCSACCTPYCSPICQKRDWNSHQISCPPVMPPLVYGGPFHSASGVGNARALPEIRTAENFGGRPCARSEAAGDRQDARNKDDGRHRFKSDRSRNEGRGPSYGTDDRRNNEDSRRMDGTGSNRRFGGNRLGSGYSPDRFGTDNGRQADYENHRGPRQNENEEDDKSKPAEAAPPTATSTASSTAASTTPSQDNTSAPTTEVSEPKTAENRLGGLLTKLISKPLASSSEVITLAERPAQWSSDAYA